MEGGNNLANNFTIYLMLIICVILLTVDSIEIWRISNAWSIIHKFDRYLFDKCMKSELVMKTVFAVFSFLAAISAFVLTILIAINLEYFIQKLLAPYIQINYIIFGPSMLGFCIFGFMNWSEVVYQCDRKSMQNKVFSLANMFSLIGCFLISLTITIVVVIYDTVMAYVDSILRRDNGSKFLRSTFWWAVMRTSGPDFLRRPVVVAENQENERNVENAENNNQNNRTN